MKKIAVYLTCSADWGGAFQYAQLVLRALTRLDKTAWQIKAFYLVPGWAEVLSGLGLEGELLAPRRTLAERAAGRLHGLFGEKLPLALADRLLARSYPHYLLGRENPDIIIAPEQKFVAAPGVKRRLAVIHDLMHIYEPSFPEVGSAQELAGRNRLYAAIMRHNTDVLVDSETGRGHVRANFPAPGTRLHVLPYAAPGFLLEAAPQRPAAVLPEHFFFYPAQFWPHKNHARLAEALAALRGAYPDIHLVFSGSTKYDGYAAFMRKAEELSLQGHFTSLGYVSTPELAWLYRHARALIMPTFFGPTNIPPLEAMALGCPVAISGTYGMPEQCGDAALYMQPDSVGSIAEAMGRLWSDEALRRALREKGLARAKEWNEEAFIKEFLKIVSG